MAAPQDDQNDDLNITADLLLRAYSIGLFPMAEHADDTNLFWLDPPQRGIFPLDGLIVGHSLEKLVRRDHFKVSINTCFAAVVAACAEQTASRNDTWINADIKRLYNELNEGGFAHSIEVFDENGLAGGLYGVAMGGAFFGESMFHRARDASKVALVHLVARLRICGFQLLDTQFVTPHLASMGAIEIERSDYLNRLQHALDIDADFTTPLALSGAEILRVIASLESDPAR